LVTAGVETALYKRHQRKDRGKDRNEGEDEEEDKNSHWVTLRKREDTGNWQRKHQIAVYEDLAF
jgi:hypothetical protein